MMTHDDHDHNRFDPMIGVWRVWFIRPSGRASPWIQISVSGANMVVIGVRPGECWKLENESLGSGGYLFPSWKIDTIG